MVLFGRHLLSWYFRSLLKFRKYCFRLCNNIQIYSICLLQARQQTFYVVCILHRDHFLPVGVFNCRPGRKWSASRFVSCSKRICHTYCTNMLEGSFGRLLRWHRKWKFWPSTTIRLPTKRQRYWFCSSCRGGSKLKNGRYCRR